MWSNAEAERVCSSAAQHCLRALHTALGGLYAKPTGSVHARGGHHTCSTCAWMPAVEALTRSTCNAVLTCCLITPNCGVHAVARAALRNGCSLAAFKPSSPAEPIWAVAAHSQAQVARRSVATAMQTSAARRSAATGVP
jgi:hypothetical protein